MEEKLNYKIYTPEKYAVRMAKDSLDEYFQNFEDENLEKIRIIDISCGSGNLLLPILEELIKKSKIKFGKYKFNKDWITGFDIDGNALEVLKLRAKTLLGKYGLKGELKIKKSNSLLENFEEKYHIVIGNPPYLGEKNHKEIFQEMKETEFGKKYYEAKMDYLYFFIEKGVDILADNGIIKYLTTNYWLKADSGKKLRKKLIVEGSFQKIENYSYSLFEKAIGQHNIIFSWEKGKEIQTVEIHENEITYEVDKSDIYIDEKIVLIPPFSKEIIKKIKENSNQILGDLLKVNQGIVSGADKAFVFKEMKDEFKEYLKPFYKNKDIGRYKVSKEPPFWIMYLSKHSNPSNEILNYLENFEEKLKNRREAKSGFIPWWGLQWARDEEIFTKEKIVVRQRCKTNNFGYSNSEFYGSADIYYLTPKNNETDLLYILGYLNSSIFLEWFKFIGKKKGPNFEFYSTPLKEVPIYYPEKKDDRKYIIELVKKQIENYDEKIQEKIDEYFKEKLIK